MTVEIKNRSGEVIHIHDGDMLSGASLRLADLRGANLRGADLSTADLSGMRVSKNTQF